MSKPSQSPTISFEEAVTNLDEDKKKLVAELHNKALNLGCIATIAKAGKKDGSYKIEYKADKKAYVLFISRISKNGLSIGCKLLHLGKYTQLIDELSETVRNELLAAKACNVDKGCTAYIRFTYDGKEYLTCRHTMRLKTPTYSDLPSLWQLLEAEAAHRIEV